MQLSVLGTSVSVPDSYRPPPSVTPQPTLPGEHSQERARGQAQGEAGTPAQVSSEEAEQRDGPQDPGWGRGLPKPCVIREAFFTVEPVSRLVVFRILLGKSWSKAS